MPMKWYLGYPPKPEWTELSQRIRQRDGNKCKFCGVPNGVEIVRSSVDPARYMYCDPETGYWLVDGSPVRLSQIPNEFLAGYADDHIKWVVLTTAHLDQNPANNDDCNLASLCQRCHLNHDRAFNIPKARHTRNNNRRLAHLVAGQLELEMEIE